MKANKQHKLAAKAGNKNVTDYENAPVSFTKSERKEIVEAARQFCKESDVRPTPARIRQVILDEHGKAVANAICGKQSKAATKAPRKTKAKKIVRLVFGFPVSAVARALGKAGVKPAAAVAAIHEHQPEASVLAIKTFVHAGRHGLRGKPAKLTAQQLKSLKAVA
jgi:hypothetical protein